MTGARKGESEINWYEVDEEKQGVDTRDNVKHIERNGQLFVG